MPPPRDQRKAQAANYTYTQGGGVFSNLTAARDIKINHITSVCPLAHSLYQSFPRSSGYFSQVRNELELLIPDLEDAQKHISDSQAGGSQSPELDEVLKSCHSVLGDVSQIKQHSNGVGYQDQAAWDRMEWCVEELGVIRARIESLKLAEVSLKSSTANIERMLTAYINASRSSKRNGSAASTITSGSLSKTEQEAWRDVRRELQGVGITPEMFSQHIDYIKTRISTAVREGSLGDIYELQESSDHEQLPGPSDSTTSLTTISSTISSISSILSEQEKHSAAEAAYRYTWERQKRALGKNHADTLDTLSALGDALDDQGKYAEAEVVHRDVWKARKRTLGKNDADTLRSLTSLGDALSMQEKHAEAEVAYRDAWARQKRALGKNHADTLDTLSALGDALDDQGKYAEAESMYRDVWRRKKRTLGNNHNETLEALHTLGDVLMSQKKYSDAASVYRQEWSGYKEVLGENHKDTLSSLESHRDADRKSSRATPRIKMVAAKRPESPDSSVGIPVRLVSAKRPESPDGIRVRLVSAKRPESPDGIRVRLVSASRRSS